MIEPEFWIEKGKAYTVMTPIQQPGKTQVSYNLRPDGRIKIIIEFRVERDVHEIDQEHRICVR